jgi:hypothetical protein
MPVQKEMIDNHFNNVIRLLHRADRERVLWVRHVTFTHLRRLGVKRDPTKAVAKMPAGSDQCDTGSIRDWCIKLKSCDTEAIKQLVAIDATACLRS